MRNFATARRDLPAAATTSATLGGDNERNAYSDDERNTALDEYAMNAYGGRNENEDGCNAAVAGMRTACLTAPALAQSGCRLRP